MDRKLTLQKVVEAYNLLKDFQRSTVQNAIHHLYEKNNPEDRHLIADEVGLGKTIVARGIIAKRMETILNDPKVKNNLRIVYICSNQAIARQNLRKLNILGDDSVAETSLGRLVFLALKGKRKDGLQITALTPSTSFEVKRGTGLKKERKLIWMLLTRYEVFRRNGRDQGLKYVLLGTVKRVDQWLNEVENYANYNQSRIKEHIRIAFKKAVQNHKINLQEARYAVIADELNYYYSKEKNLQEILIDYAELLTKENVSKMHGPNKILGDLRDILTDICTEYLEADLFILDEFQRFKKLIDTYKNEEKISDAARIAKKVFEQHHSKILMLSATPFKSYSTSLEQELGESHFEEFKTVLTFLLQDQDGERLEYFEDENKNLRELLRQPEMITTRQKKRKAKQAKLKLENLYQKVISRTERIIVSDDKNTLLSSSTTTSDTVQIKDVEHFCAIDQLVQMLKESEYGEYINSVRYAKSCPYLFSFMDGYKVKKDLIDAREKNALASLKDSLLDHRKAWLNLGQINKYSLNLKESPHPKLRSLWEKAFENKLWKQLWIQPSLPYYEPQGAYSGAKNCSKILLFSNWVMVPRMISTLISYEAERMVLSGVEKSDENLTYFLEDESRRKPTPVLQLRLKEAKPTSMRTFTLLYPSLTLIGLHNIRENLEKTRSNPSSYRNLKETIKTRVKRLIKNSGIKKYANQEANVSSDWYWAAPVLLDKFYQSEIYNEWLGKGKIQDSLIYGGLDNSVYGDAISEDKSTPTTQSHIEELMRLYKDPENFELGAMPNIEDLAEVLALMVMGSPANVSYRVFDQYYKNGISEELTLNKLSYSLDIAYEFRSLFDKPESISIVRRFNSRIDDAQDSSNVGKYYWFYVLQYAVDGNLQATFDEYGHLLDTQLSELAVRHCKSMA